MQFQEPNIHPATKFLQVTG